MIPKSKAERNQLIIDADSWKYPIRDIHAPGYQTHVQPPQPRLDDMCPEVEEQQTSRHCVNYERIVT